MNEYWKQFSLYPPGCRNKFQPQQVLHSFLPAYIKAIHPIQWHVLFEPSALIRIRCDDLDQAMYIAREMAPNCGLVFEPGDCSSEFNKSLQWPSEDYGMDHGEGEWWKVSNQFLHACSEMSLHIQKLGPLEQLNATRRCIHLFLNALGLNYLEEAAVCRHSIERTMDLMKQYYRM